MDISRFLVKDRIRKTFYQKQLVYVRIFKVCIHFLQEKKGIAEFFIYVIKMFEENEILINVVKYNLYLRSQNIEKLNCKINENSIVFE